MLKKLPIFCISLLMLITSLNAQIVFTEVFYNAPGTDTIEFIEMYNNSADAIQMEGYHFSQGIVFSFPDYMLGAGEYVVLTNNSAAMMGFFGINTLQWFDGGLNNSGEDIQLNNADTTMVIDYINYDDGTFWPSEADGEGYSMELCDPNENNADPSNWYASLTDPQLALNGTAIFASPGLENEVVCNPPAVTVTSSGLDYSPANVTIFVGETVQWMNVSGTHNVNGSMATFPGNSPEFFFSGAPSGAAWTFSHTFNTAGTYDYQCDPHASLGMIGTVTVLPIPTYDLVINEIMYNPPGEDALGEFIELYNNQATAIDLTGFEFSQGVEYTFPNITLGAGEYLLLASDSVSFEAFYGVPARQWTAGGLNNGGEEIVLEDNMGNLVDIVIYDNNSPWQEIANGEGPSLALCDPSTSNTNPNNWAYSTDDTGMIPPGTNEFVFASPGAANNCPAGPQLFFNGITDEVDEGAMLATFTVRMPVLSITDSADVDIVVDPLTTATEGIDFSIINTTIHFSPDSPGEVSEAEIEIGLIDDTEIEGDETIVLQMQNAVGATIATTGLYTITIIDNDGNNYTSYPIGTVTTNDADGVADSLGIPVSLTGIVHNPNLRPGGLQFTIIDANEDGIGVFNFSENYDYEVTEGDLVTVNGEIDQFNGLTQIVADTVILISQNAPLFAPNIVTSLDESTESQLIRFNNMTIVDPSEWTNAGSGFNVTITDGTNEFEMRIDADTDIYGTAPPGWNFDLIGIGGQFDNSSPFDAGYQIIPRYLEDIMLLPNDNVIAIDDNVTTSANQPITIDVLANDNIPFGIGIVQILINPSFGTAVVNGDSTITYTPNLDFCGTDALTYRAIDDLTLEVDEAVLTINVECPPSYPLYDIADVTTNNAVGVPDSLETICELRGVVYGVNMNSNGLQFTIIDENDPEAGITVYDGGENFGYTVNEGDLVACQGEIGQFNGLTQMYLDSVYIVSTNATLHDPEAVTAFDESTESKLVKIFNVIITDPTDWDNSGSGFNVSVSDGTNNYTVRIDNDVELYDAMPPNGVLNITGIGGQFDQDEPFDSGYQLLPRYNADIEFVISTGDLADALEVSIFPNPAASLLNINASERPDQILIYNQLGQLIHSQTDISNNNMVNVEKFVSGIYFVAVMKDGKQVVEKVFVEGRR